MDSSWFIIIMVLNGMAFPWDNDIDVQVPIMVYINYLYIHQTIVVEDPEDGFGRYFLDIGFIHNIKGKR